MIVCGKCGAIGTTPCSVPRCGWTPIVQKRVQCVSCGGKGWVGAATGGMFAAIGRLAMAGRLPKRDCPDCNGLGWTNAGEGKDG